MDIIISERLQKSLNTLLWNLPVLRAGLGEQDDQYVAYVAVAETGVIWFYVAIRDVEASEENQAHQQAAVDDLMRGFQLSPV